MKSEQLEHTTNKLTSLLSQKEGQGSMPILSILIPTYNYNVCSLVHDLIALSQKERIEVEIIIGDDASTKADCIQQNDALEQLPNVRVLHNEHNLGRAENRNQLARESRGEWILFIDSDAQVTPEFSLQLYLTAGEHSEVVCGGLYHPATNPMPEASLRYKYERRADQKRSAAFRSKTPYQHLTTFNIFMRRSTFLKIQFDKDCKEYGYEDALFGVELKKRHVSISHIDNPLVHVGLEPNDIYLKKTEIALHTLVSLQGKMLGLSHVENAAHRLQQFHLAAIFKDSFRLFSPLLRKNLLGNNPSLFVFSLYKLGYYLNIKPTALGGGPFTIVVPFHNRDSFLPLTLQSIADTNNRPPLHLILVDNQSTDKSVEICERFAELNREDDFKITITSESTPGAYAARNKGLALCTTPYIYFFDSDDEFDSDFFTYLNPELKKAENAQLDLLAITTLQNVGGKTMLRQYRETSDVKAQILISHLNTVSMIFRTDFLREIGGWAALRVWDDWELGLRALLHHPRMQWFTKRPFHQIHVHPDSITGADASSRFERQLHVLRHVHQELSAPADLQALYYRHCILAGQLLQEKNKSAAQQCEQQINQLFPQEKNLFGRFLKQYVSRGFRGAWKLAFYATKIP